MYEKAASQPASQPHSARRVISARMLLWVWENPVSSSLLALVIYAAVASLHGSIFGLSEHPYYNYLADAYLHGQLALRVIPPSVYDLVLYGGEVYLYWPPLPAILLMPFVAIFGLNFSDIAFTLGIGAANVGLMAVLMREVNTRGVISLTRSQRGLLVLFFAAGTVYFTLAPRGRVWFTGQITGFLCILLAYIFALRYRGWKAFLLAGLAVAGAAATRNSMVFAAIWPAYYLLREHWSIGLKKLAGYAVAGAVPVLLTVALLALHNYVRFGSFTDVGIAYHQMGQIFVEDYARYGYFNLHYLPINLYYQYIFYPLPFRLASLMGGSLFLLSPLFFAIFWAFGKSNRAESWSLTMLVLSILLTNIPILLLMGTGFVTYGPRYTLDFTVPLMLLTAIGMRRWPAVVAVIAVLLSIAQYAVGAFIPLT